MKKVIFLMNLFESAEPDTATIFLLAAGLRGMNLLSCACAVHHSCATNKTSQT